MFAALEGGLHLLASVSERMQDNKEMVKFAQRYVESFKGAVVDQAV